MNRDPEVSWPGPPGWRCPAGTVVVVTSVNRLVAARPHSVEHVEAPDPDIIMRRPNDLGKDHGPSDGINAIAFRLSVAQTNRARPDQLQRGERYRLGAGSKKGA